MISAEDEGDSRGKGFPGVGPGCHRFALMDGSQEAATEATGQVDDGWLASTLSEIQAAEPLIVKPQASVKEVAAAMRALAASAAVVDGDPLGIVTDSDLRSRVLAEGLPPHTTVGEIMTSPVRTIDADQPAFAALLLMLEAGVHHVPVVRDDRVVAMLTDADLLRLQDSHPLLVLERIRRADRVDALRGHLDEVVDTARALARQGVDAVRVARVVAGLNDALVARVLRLAERGLEPVRGAPPCPYAFLVLGSAGRMEPGLSSDLDSAIAYQDDTEQAADYFAALAARAVEGIHTAGFPPCTGGYEADRWFRPLNAWQATFERWLAAPIPEVLVEAENFLDLRRVYGDLSVMTLDETLTHVGADRPRLLVQMARAAVTFTPPLGLFGRLRTDEGRIDIKRGGIAPLVLLARLYALSAGVSARSTPERLAQAASVGGELSPQTAGELSDAFAFLTELRLRAQLADLDAGRQPANDVRLADLSPFEQRSLHEAFRAIQRVQRSVQTRWMTDTVS